MIMTFPPPKLNPKSGRWRFRKFVPLDLRHVVGAGEKVQWLGRDPEAARKKNAELHLHWDERFRSLRSGVTSLTRKDAVELADRWYAWFVGRFEGAPGNEPDGWMMVIGQLQDVGSWGDDSDPDEADEPRPRGVQKRVEAFLHDRGQVAQFLNEQTLQLTAEATCCFLEVLEREFIAAHQLLARRARDDYGPDERSPRVTAPAPKKPLVRQGDISVMGLLEGLLRELRASGRGAEAERRWTPVFRQFTEFLGHDDAARVTADDVIRWKEHRLTTRALKTVKDTDLASIRSVFRWAVDNKKVKENPAAGITIRGAKIVRTDREKGHTVEEAAGLLEAALRYTRPEKESESMAAAKRWAPWICAYTGARIAEVTQLRAEDVMRREGIAFFRFTPAAGSIKNDQYRDVPLHPHLIELGVLDFVEGVGNGPLFFDAGVERMSKRHPSKFVAERVAKWVRSLGVVGAQVKPNHGWRHRLKTVARENQLDDRVVEALQGRAARTAGDDYGDVTLKARLRVIESLPRYEVQGPDA